jgi:hypothetical protein
MKRFIRQCGDPWARGGVKEGASNDQREAEKGGRKEGREGG